MRKLLIKAAPDGRAMLNLACGTKMDWRWNNLDFSPYAFLVSHPILISVLRHTKLLSAQRAQRLSMVDPQVICWDLRKGIPFALNSFDVVYHSHFLEHVPKEQAGVVLKECWRVLKPGGIIRVVVPDLEVLARRYLASLQALEAGLAAAQELHQKAIDSLFDQMVRTKATGSGEQKPFVAALERKIRGGADATGELHRWMYDKHSLSELLGKAGFKQMTVQVPTGSGIKGWQDFQLDINQDGSPHHPNSLYLEGGK